MKTAMGAFGAIRAIEIVSGWPGVTKPSDPTLAFRKTNFVRGFDFFEESCAPPDLAGAIAGTSSAPTRAAMTAAVVRVPLPADTR